MRGEEGGVSHLLEGDGVKHELRASSDDARELALEAEANVERA
jgi:hypothetical protein